MSPINITIDGQAVSVASGESVLAAARHLDIDIPTLCFMEDFPPNTSCMACLVKLTGRPGLVPACATKAAEGMVIESETEEVHAARQTALELILSEHVGDCIAPCHRICPVDLPIPIMIRHLRQDEMTAAIKLVRDEVALPGILGRVCHRPCEGGCRRGEEDAPVAIALLERYAADQNYQDGDFFIPECDSATGKAVAIIGTGATGLTAAYHLLRLGHAVTLFDKAALAGGALRAFPEEELPKRIVDNEIEIIRRLGAEFKLNTMIGGDDAAEACGENTPRTVDDLATTFNAVLIATGAIEKHPLLPDLVATKDGVKVDRKTFATSSDGIFAAGEVIRASGMVSRAAGAGKSVAVSIHQFVTEQPVTGAGKPFTVHMNKPAEDELDEFMKLSSGAARVDPKTEAAGFNKTEADDEGQRCLHCDCRAAGNCDLRNYSEKYGADPNRFKSQKKHFVQDVEHPDIVFDARKCIACGRCLQVARQGDEDLGLAFNHRSFDMQLGVPLSGSLAEGLKIVGQEAVRVCPTAGLALKEEDEKNRRPGRAPVSQPTSDTL